MAESNKKDFISFLGRRKESVARLRLYTSSSSDLLIGEEKLKKGDIVVNGKRVEDYFKGIVAKARFEEPLKITNNLGKYILSVKVDGGGNSGQLEAFIHALSRALASIDDKNKQILRKQGLLTRDARVRERRKVGMGGKSRRKRQSPKR
ncbi:MAG: 30S ribosomal protein S9 [Candidatus Levybacteria bacterium]|nr:30S ribosomal protein S9 [Candidatus Levybacteria bacterium]